MTAAVHDVCVCEYFFHEGMSFYVTYRPGGNQSQLDVGVATVSQCDAT